MAARIVLIDSNQEEGSRTAAALARCGLAAETWPANDLLPGRLARDPPCLVLLHRRLRVEPDLGTLRRVRAASAVPAILRAMDADDEADRVHALEIGADDYLTRGTSAREMLARINTVLRRARSAPPAAAASGWLLCRIRREVFTPDGTPGRLTSTEFELLQVLAHRQGEAQSRDTLSAAVLRRPYRAEDRALDNLVLRLRRKIGDGGARPRLIKSVRGIGYVFTGFDRPGHAELLAGEAQAEATA